MRMSHHTSGRRLEAHSKSDTTPARLEARATVMAATVAIHAPSAGTGSGTGTSAMPYMYGTDSFTLVVSLSGWVCCAIVALGQFVRTPKADTRI
jgi:hypothetical protein